MNNLRITGIVCKREEPLGSLEHIVLLTVMRLGDNAYGITVRSELEGTTGRNLSIGAVYATLVPKGDREPLIGDFAEEYALRANAASSSAALKWYLLQICASIPSLLWLRLTRAMWPGTLGVALLVYFVVGVVQLEPKSNNHSVATSTLLRACGLVDGAADAAGISKRLEDRKTHRAHRGLDAGFGDGRKMR
jgi:hypothetical protein